jgi:predicted metal-dependent hydrolase
MIENGHSGGGFLLRYDGQVIPFRITYRRRKHLSITVHPEMRLEVTAPEGVGQEAVLAKLEKRAAWIVRQWRHFEQYQPTQPGPRYVSGETHLYLGRQYRLKVREGSPEGVKLVGRFLHVHTSSGEEGEQVGRLLDAWYRAHAKQVFSRRLEGCLGSARSLGLKGVPNLILRKMAKRWGSCTRAGNILLNLDLVRVPVHCIDYVIIHELCHLKVHNHGREFYRLLARCLPDWDARKKRLEAVVL